MNKKEIVSYERISSNVIQTMLMAEEKNAIYTLSYMSRKKKEEEERVAC
jgi:hypothetical protein